MNNFSRINNSFINISVNFAGYFINIVLSFICRVFFVRILGAEYLGINSLFSSILSLLSLSELGIGTAMIYALYAPVARDDKEKISAYLKLYGVAYRAIGIIVFLLGLVLILFFPVLITEPPNISENLVIIYILFLISTASSYFFSYKSSILIVNQKNYIVVAINYIIVIIQNIIQIIILASTKNYYLYLILQVIFTLIYNIIISKKAEKDYPYICEKKVTPLQIHEKKSLFLNIKALTITKLSGIIVNNTDSLVITYFNGLIQTGIISNYSLIVSILNNIANQAFTSLSASLGNLNAIGEEDHKYKVFLSLNLSNFWIFAWLSIAIVNLSSDIITLFFGNEFVLNISIPIILALNFYILGMQCVVGLYKSTMGLFKHGQYMLLFTAVINLTGDFILGKNYGVIGILLATAIARIFTNVWYEPYAIYRFGFHKKVFPYFKRYILYFFIVVTTCLICFFVCSNIAVNLFVDLFLKILVCTLIPNAIFFFVFHKWDEFIYLKNVVSQIIKYIFKKKVGH